MQLRNMLLAATVFAGGIGIGAGAAWSDDLRVVASIKPVHALVAGVMQGVGTPALLVKGAGSPHTYSLRPSEAAALEEAEVVFWVGEDLETFLLKPLEALSSDARVVELAATGGLTPLATREGGMWELEAGHDAHGEHEEHEHGAEHGGHGRIDMHLWLDPRNAAALVDRIAAALSEADPDDADAFAANAAAYKERLAELDGALMEALAPVADRPFVVFHDAYQYFEERYGLNALGSITINPERRPGARRLDEIRDRLVELEAACVFAEPQFEPALVRTIVEGTGTRTGTLDPLGAEIDAGPDHYPELMRGLAEALVDCLGNGGRG